MVMNAPETLQSLEWSPPGNRWGCLARGLENGRLQAVNERLKKLRARGDIRAYVALINPVTVGYTTCAFVHLLLEGKKNEQAFIQSVLKMP